MNDRSRLQLLETKDFDRYLMKLARQGADAVYREVVGALVLWGRNEEPPLPRTHQGESRIPHVVKYDLCGHFRLVVYEHAGKRIPLMVGDHEEAEQWLKNNRGKDYSVNVNSKRVQFTIAKLDQATTEAATSQLDVPPTKTGPVFAKLPAELINALGLPEPVLTTLNTCVTFEKVKEGVAWTWIQALMFPSEEHRHLVMQTIALLAQGQDEEARERVELFIGNADTATNSPDSFVEAIDSGTNSDLFFDLSSLSEGEIQRLLNAKGLTDWMLYLHPDQKKLVEREYNGPARVIGVSGAGKTAVLVHRAYHLAKKYPGERILVVSLNAALCRLISQLLDDLCSLDVRPRIEVSTVYNYCYQAVHKIEPGRLIENYDPRSGEDLPACWREFMKKQHALDTVQPLLSALEKSHDYIDGRAYVLEELIWIRSGFGHEDREFYLICDRQGRGIRLHELHRSRLLKLLRDYEEYMGYGGLADPDGVSLAAFSVRQRIKEHPSLRARCVLIDEVQDCSTVELAVMAEIPTAPVNGLYLTGDPIQKVFPKHHDLVQAGIDIKGRATVLRRNYRNSREILEAGFRMIHYFRDIAPVPKDEIVEPDYAFRNGSRPTLYECSSRREQLSLILWFLSRLPEGMYDATCVGSPTEHSLRKIEEACAAKRWPTFRITGATSRQGVIGPGIKLSLLPDLKGYEFHQVFLVDLMDSQLLPKGMPWEERWRIAFQLYVAMTRARDELVMSYVLNRSTLLGPLDNTVNECDAAELLDS